MPTVTVGPGHPGDGLFHAARHCLVPCQGEDGFPGFKGDMGIKGDRVSVLGCRGGGGGGAGLWGGALEGQERGWGGAAGGSGGGAVGQGRKAGEFGAIGQLL